MNVKLKYTAPECELVFTQQAMPLCQSGINEAMLMLNSLENDTDAITWEP